MSSLGDSSLDDDCMRSKLLVFALIPLLLIITNASAANNISEAIGPYLISLCLPDYIKVTVITTTETGQSFYGDKYTGHNLNIKAKLDPTHVAAIEITENG